MHRSRRVSLTLTLVTIPVTTADTHSTLQITILGATARIPFITLKQEKLMVVTNVNYETFPSLSGIKIFKREIS
jgi:hypothetical protein